MAESSLVDLTCLRDIQNISKRRNLQPHKPITKSLFFYSRIHSRGMRQKRQIELAHFLNVALGSANETEYFLLLSKDLGYTSIAVYDEMNINVNEVKAMLISLIRKVRQ